MLTVMHRGEYSVGFNLKAPGEHGNNLHRLVIREGVSISTKPFYILNFTVQILSFFVTAIFHFRFA